jgi:hypothetical protein
MPATKSSNIPLRLRLSTRQATALETRFKPPAHLAVRLPKSHTMLSQAGSDREHDAVATVPIIGASRGIGLETVKAAEQRDELASLHSITSSARASSVAGISMSIVRAVFRLMMKSNLVARWTGSSPGFSPLRMRPA